MSHLHRLLEQITDSELRLKFNAVAQEVPQLDQWIADPAAVRKAGEFEAWARDSWDHEHEMTKAEYAYSQQIAQLQNQLEGQGNMTLEELNQNLDRFASEKGLMTQTAFNDALKAKETEFNNHLNAMARIATKVPFLNQRHEREFGETFDPEAFLTKAHDAGAQNLDSFYDEFTKDKRKAKQDEEIERRVNAAKEDGKREAMQAQAMSQNGQMPTLDGTPEIGHFQRSFMNMKEQGSAVPVSAELGKGQIARAAAHAGDIAAFSGRVQ